MHSRQKLEADSSGPREDKTKNQTMYINECAPEGGKDSSLLIHGFSFNLPLKSVEPRLFLENVRNVHMSGLHQMNTDLQMNSECMECV